jgi:hypothetical protein
MLDTDVTRVIGETWVEALELRDRSGVTRILETDGLIVSGQFLPESTLVRESHLAFDKASGGPEIDQYGRCSDPDYFAAGNLLRPVETAGWSWAEGCSVAQAIAASLKGRLRAPVASLRLGMIGDALKYAIPQRIVSDEETKPGHRHIQLRVHRPVRAQLAAMSDGREVWHRTLTALPERRILVPLAVLPKYSGARVSISLKELPT